MVCFVLVDGLLQAVKTALFHVMRLWRAGMALESRFMVCMMGNKD